MLKVSMETLMMKMIDTLSVKGRQQDTCPFIIKQNVMERKGFITSYHQRMNKIIHIKEIISLMKSNGLLPERKSSLLNLYANPTRTTSQL